MGGEGLACINEFDLLDGFWLREDLKVRSGPPYRYLESRRPDWKNGEAYWKGWPAQEGDLEQKPYICRAASDFLMDDQRFKSCSKMAEEKQQYQWQPKECDMDRFSAISFLESLRNKY